MSNRPRKTKPVKPEYITRRELVVFARAVDARIAQEVGKLRHDLNPPPADCVCDYSHTGQCPVPTTPTSAEIERLAAEIEAEQRPTVPTDSEGAE